MKPTFGDPVLEKKSCPNCWVIWIFHEEKSGYCYCCNYPREPMSKDPNKNNDMYKKWM